MSDEEYYEVVKYLESYRKALENIYVCNSKLESTQAISYSNEQSSTVHQNKYNLLLSKSDENIKLAEEIETYVVSNWDGFDLELILDKYIYLYTLEEIAVEKHYHISTIYAKLKKTVKNRKNVQKSE